MQTWTRFSTFKQYLNLKITPKEYRIVYLVVIACVVSMKDFHQEVIQNWNNYSYFFIWNIIDL